MKKETHLKLVANSADAPEATAPQVSASDWPLVGSEADLI